MSRPHQGKGDSMLLTKDEIAVLQFIAEGKTVTEISFFLSLPLRSVESKRQEIMEKLQLYSIADLTKYAVQKGLTPLGN